MSLKIVNLSKRFKNRWVLRDVSFEVAKGEVFGIAGASGSGKTTVLNAIAGAIPTNGGEIVVDRSSPVLYSPGATNDTSIWSRLFRNRRPTGSSQLLQSLLAQVEKQTGVLLLDDPFTGLDASIRELVENAINSAGSRGVTVIVASSDFEEIMAVCDRAAVLASSDIKQIGTPKQLYEEPESRIVAEATGRCNLFAGRRLSSSKAEIAEFHTIEGGHRLFARTVERGALGAINQNVTLGIRPEHISISFGASFPEDNLLRAMVTGVRFLGPNTLIDLDSGGLKLQSLVLRLVGLNVGDECVVGLPIDKVHIFRE